ncbi:MAG: gliding motility protein GldL [Bacteroidota bacterium]
MRLRELVKTRGWKITAAKMYSWGASVVMIGALMKLEHFPLSTYFLCAGLGTEAIIFFFSGFEALPEEWEWDRVYPELATNNGTKAERKAMARPAASGTALQKFDEMLEKAEITPELFAKLGNGMKNLAESASQMTDISHAHVVSSHFTESMREASEKLNNFSDAYERSTEELNKSANSLTQSYNKTADQAGHLAQSGQSYTEMLEKMNKNLAALNSVYELQLKGEDSHLKATTEIYAGLDSMIQNLEASVQNTKQYREEVDRLGRKLVALNKVYGNMLTAMNVREDV